MCGTLGCGTPGGVPGCGTLIDAGRVVAEDLDDDAPPAVCRTDVIAELRGSKA